LPRARVAVCGLNPHAGEGGEFGDEEIKIITPTVRAAQKRGLDVAGPLSGDTVFIMPCTGILTRWWRCITTRGWRR
jgi:4-phospho-D-threonate 3-dehydrogenase / 4-phospho-D-erythronate 3-dehydrogenase